MRCPQCQFENIPGQDRCLRCGSILEAKDVAVEVHPPRMARWKAPVRAVVRWLRLRNALPESLSKPKVPAFMKIMSGNAFFGLILSIVPGLAHYFEGRFREVRWFVLGWLLALLAGIFFYGGAAGFLLLGLAVGLHGWIAFGHALSKEQVEITDKLVTYAMLLALFGLFYWGIRNSAFRDFVFGYTNQAVPYQDVQPGDLLLARRSLSAAANLYRGSLVLAPVANIGGGYGVHMRALRNGPLMAGQIVAVAGEKVEIANDAFIVDGQPLDGARFPVPQWLLSQKTRTIRVPGDSYFLSAAYNLDIHGNAVLGAGLVERACLVKYSEVEAKAIMRWFPLGRRGFLRADE